jgi:hypothetical protein
MKTRNLLWHLTTSELQHRQRLISTVYAVVLLALTIRLIGVLLFTTVAADPDGFASQIEVTVWATIAASALITHGLFSGYKRQKRNRLLSSLPVSPRTVAWSRLLALALIHVIPFVFWIVGYAGLRIGHIAGYDRSMGLATLPPRQYGITAATPLVLLAISLIVCLIIGLAHTWKKPLWVNALYWILAAGFMNLLVYPAGSSPELFVLGYSVFTSFWGVLYYWTAALILAGLIVMIHTRKRSFID